MSGLQHDHGHHDHGHHGHDHGHDHRHAPGGRDWGEIADQIELDGEVLSPMLHQAIDRVRAAVGDGPVRRVVDAGAGPGVAACELARAFPDATVLAIDGAAPVAERAAVRAARLGVGDRVATQAADLEHGLPVEGPVDVVWSSMVLHHVADPARVLADAHAALRPGGVVAIVEFGPPTSTLPADLGVGTPGLRDRYEAAVRAAIADHLPPGAFDLDWPALLVAAGFEHVETLPLRLHRPAPLDDDARRWVLHNVQRVAPMVAQRLDAADVATLESLPELLARRDDLEVHAARVLYVGRRP